MTKETSRSDDGRKLMITRYEEIGDFEAIVAAIVDHFAGEAVQRTEVLALGQLSVLIECRDEVLDVVFDEAWGISIRTEVESSSLLQLIADFLDSYLPKNRAPASL
jgi:hypothetical protein